MTTKNKKQKKGLWARLFYESDGDETKTKVAYLKERVDELKAARARSKKPIKAEATAPSAPPEEVKEEL